MDHEELQEYTIKNLCHYWPKMTEIGPYNEPLRFDAITIHRSVRKVRIFEIKTNRSDFLGDKKWEKYLDYCTYFAFVVPEGLVDKSELPKNVGLIYIYNDPEKPGWKLPMRHEYVKNCTAIRSKINQEKYIQILEAMTARVNVEEGKGR